MRGTLTEFSRGLSALVATAMRGVVTLVVQAKDGQVGGSGFLIDPNGHLVTNHHVVESLQPPVDVVLHGDATTTASIVGIDPVSDLALLRLEKPVPYHLHLRDEPARHAGRGLPARCEADDRAHPPRAPRREMSFSVIPGTWWHRRLLGAEAVLAAKAAACVPAMQFDSGR